MTARPAPVLCAAAGCAIPGRHTDTCDRAYTEVGRCAGCLPGLAADGIRLCGHHRRLLAEDALIAVVRYNDLGLVLAGGTAALGDMVTTRGADPNLKLNHAAAAARHRIRAELVALVRLVASERGVSLPGGWVPEQLPDGFVGPPRLVWRVADRMPALGRFVAQHAEWLAAHPAAAEHSVALRELADGESFRVAYPAGTRRFVVTLPDGSYARCPERVDELDAAGEPVPGKRVACPGALWTVLRSADSLLPSQLLCNHDPDSHQWPASAWLKLGRRLLSANRVAPVDPASLPTVASTGCDCACHTGGAFRPACSVPGGCGSIGCDGRGTIRGRAA